MANIKRLLGQAEVYLRDVDKVPLRATDAVLVQGALDAILSVIAALEAEPEPLAVVEAEAIRNRSRSRRFRATAYFDCEEESRLVFPVTVTITRKP